MERYIKAKHLLVSLTGEPTGTIDPILEERGLKRRIVATVNQFAVAPRLLVNSDLIAVLPARIVQISGLLDLLYFTSLPVEINLAPSTVKMMWHERNHRDSAQIWLRSRLIEICAQNLQN